MNRTCAGYLQLHSSSGIRPWPTQAAGAGYIYG